VWLLLYIQCTSVQCGYSCTVYPVHFCPVWLLVCIQCTSVQYGYSYISSAFLSSVATRVQYIQYTSVQCGYSSRLSVIQLSLFYTAQDSEFTHRSVSFKLRGDFSEDAARRLQLQVIQLMSGQSSELLDLHLELSILRGASSFYFILIATATSGERSLAH